MSATVRSSASRSTQRRGTTYAFVLLTAASIAMLAVTAMLAQRLRTRAVDRESGGRTAQILAMSAVEHALHTMDATRVADGTGNTWRQTLQGMSFSGPLGDGTIAWSFQDAGGGDMDTDAEKVFYAVGVGAQGTASHTLRVAVRPSGPAYSSLALVLHAKDDVLLGSGTVLQSDTAIGTNGTVQASSSSVFADVEASEEIQGGTYHGTTTTFVPLRGAPGHEVFEYYWANGTVIDETDLPSSIDVRFIEDVVMSAASNPFGTANAESIYVVDCGGMDLIIRSARIFATLLIVNPGPGSVIEGSVSWSTSASSAPALLVEGGTGTIAIALSSDDLVESERGVNFNPVGTPYEGDEDITLDDAYPSRIRGLVYAEKAFVLGPPRTRIEGIVLSGAKIYTDPGAIVELTYDPKIADDPPPGFFVPDGNVRVGAFSWNAPN